jgi:hypothetical protein
VTALDDECRALARYLTGRPPDDYVLTCYRRAADFVPGATDPLQPIDRVLWRAARASRITARSADAYARWFRPAGPLRRRITLLLAILESAPGTHGWFNTAETGSRLRVSLQPAGVVAASAAMLAIGVAGFGPIHLATAWAGPRHDPAAPA